MASEIESDLRNTVDWGRKWLVWSDIDEILSFEMLELTFSYKLDWGSYIIFIAKTASKKIGALIHSIKFLSAKVALYLYMHGILLFVATTWCC